ncbi:MULTISPECIES: CRISPR-associated endoribonuclease Cas6 [Aneurinibacillus]|uniref:CRISPR-associated endoribonuclease Cas6 n=2 Tax=Aneurinibacillus thermoaerophilus TaxID=143495 RepID=A0A1G8F2F9_ANETH|nr:MULTISPECIES: CRISPR-associated endoribonuclease Cas6 [Aneurinibacillus]AMA74170.1 CRISPR-associated protein Cas6 [Aneurinibacillus sp. XH2]MED0675078.1 CRISPR-associated endoribonuclease Cas6 [Aneurinibacillus thermoaerophilus]MED0677866.1 CRISPR-associated endoribonuclease Cas6 [Aneurinibacillus thermoaerophilus]MED0736577.1 CRISPR-associated endoribonuclease Cas6 [Aneurinibacillus thermoaerophilus]MED0756527.1 CRISPR-associated endoribonuclease Cas6 [Aneurinibacillus thermoaerophilus]
MRIVFSLKTKVIPISYRMIIVSLVKECLQQANEKYYRKLYETNQAVLKPFTFAPYLKNFRFAEDEIYLDELVLTFSSPDFEFMLHFYNGLRKVSWFRYKQYEFIRGRVRMLPEQTIRNRSIIVKTQSPLLIEDENRKPVSPERPEFAKHFAYMADTILREYRGKGLRESLIVTPLAMQKKVIKESNHVFTETHGPNRYLYFTTYQGQLRLEGHPEDLQLLYQLGMGKRRGQGFGLVDVIRG